MVLARLAMVLLRLDMGQVAAAVLKNQQAAVQVAMAALDS